MLERAVVIGGGFYGVLISLLLSNSHRFRQVVLLEQEDQLLTRASRNNQARIHNGYHYPRSLLTAYRSRVNYEIFRKRWPDAVVGGQRMHYAIAKSGSKVGADQFVRFCGSIGAPIKTAAEDVRSLFEPDSIAGLFEVVESVFDYRALRQWADEQLAVAGVIVLTKTQALDLEVRRDYVRAVHAQESDGSKVAIESQFVVNCTYASLDSLSPTCHRPLTVSRVKHELTEIAIVEVPSHLVDVGITVMDGPFFSLLPHPSSGFHSLSHVRYTPHFSWTGYQSHMPARIRHVKSRAPFMIRDASRFIPDLSQLRIVDSVFEIKSVLQANEVDDGRPILFEPVPSVSGAYSVLGSKLDNVFDIENFLEAELRLIEDAR